MHGVISSMSDESTTCDSDIVYNRSKLSVHNSYKLIHTNTLIHRECYLTNALTHIIINDYKVQYSILSILLDRLGKNDCEDCKNILIDTCIEYIQKYDQFNDKLNIPLQIISVIGNEDKLNLVKDILSKYPDDDCLYWKVALFNHPFSRTHMDMSILLFNHFNIKCKTKYQQVFDELSFEISNSLWVKTLNAVHKTFSHGKFDNNTIYYYIDIINNYIETPRNNYIINGLYTMITHSILKYLDNACINYFSIKYLINGLIALISKFGNDSLKYRLNIAIRICKQLSNFNCDCRFKRLGNCVSEIMIRSDTNKLIKVLRNFTTYFNINIDINATDCTDCTDCPNSTNITDIAHNGTNELVQNGDCANSFQSLDGVISILENAIKFTESLDIIKDCINKSVDYNRNYNSKKIDELIQKLVEKYNNLNDRADFHLVLDFDLLFYENGKLKNWVRLAESCDCPGE